MKRREELQKDTRKICKLMAVFTVLIAVMVSWLYSDVKTYQIVYLSMCSLLYVNHAQ